jgi:hypothetical protein
VWDVLVWAFGWARPKCGASRVRCCGCAHVMRSCYINFLHFVELLRSSDVTFLLLIELLCSSVLTFPLLSKLLHSCDATFLLFTHLLSSTSQPRNAVIHVSYCSFSLHGVAGCRHMWRTWTFQTATLTTPYGLPALPDVNAVHSKS